jgi:hypothetical protein
VCKSASRELHVLLLSFLLEHFPDMQQIIMASGSSQSQALYRARRQIIIVYCLTVLACSYRVSVLLPC